MTINKLKIKLVQVANLFFGNRNYDKFIIVTRSRTGSNLLVSLINSHKEIDVYKTVFRILGNKSTEQIWDSIFTKKRKVKAVGFKLFYYHPEDSLDKSIWNHIKNDQSIKIIHLTRGNLLRTHISRLIAGKNQLWVNDKNERINLEDRKVKVDIDDLFEDLDLTIMYQKEVSATFNNHDFLHVQYEDLVENRGGKMIEIFDFLSVKSLKSKSDLVKQNSESIEDLVINYNEVFEKLKDTEYEWMLDN